MNDFLNKGFLFAPDDTAGGGGDGENSSSEGDNGDEGDKPTFEKWLEGQDDATKGLLDGHVKGLKSALKSERDARSDAEKSVRDLAKKAEKGSEAQKELTEVADNLAEESRRADFYESAHGEGVVNLKLAYVVAVQDEMFDNRGNVNFVRMKETYPELFGKPARKPEGGAGDGTGDDGISRKPSMNMFIRRQAGRE